MTNNEATIARHRPPARDTRAVKASPGDSFLFYFIGCGIFWRGEGQRDTLRELMLALHHVDPLVRCIAMQMLGLNRSAGVTL
jgi:hypothetical protein